MKQWSIETIGKYIKINDDILSADYIEVSKKYNDIYKALKNGLYLTKKIEDENNITRYIKNNDNITCYFIKVLDY